MTTPISNTGSNQAPAAPPAAPQAVAEAGAEAKAQPKDAPPVPTDTVHLSSAAEAILRESMETAAQTAKEANGGDIQAKHLIARQAAAKAALTTTRHIVA